MTSYGTSNTFQAMPAILDQRGYSTAAFHGDVGSFGIATILTNLGDIITSLVKIIIKTRPTIALGMG